jgi:hypothetical protein
MAHVVPQPHSCVFAASGKAALLLRRARPLRVFFTVGERSPDALLSQRRAEGAHHPERRRHGTIHTG